MPRTPDIYTMTHNSSYRSNFTVEAHHDMRTVRKDGSIREAENHCSEQNYLTTFLFLLALSIRAYAALPPVPSPTALVQKNIKSMF